MATQLAPEPEIVEEAANDRLTLIDILSGENLAFVLSETERSRIGQRVVDDVELDRGSRGDWEKIYDRSLDIAMQVQKAKNFPWPGAANVKYPLLTVASIQFQARAYPAIVDGSNLVKGRVLGPDPDGTKRARADRIGQHMTWQLLYRMPGWEEETDRLLLMLPIMGCVFRKTWFDQIENSNRSEIVSGKDFIIDYWAKSIETAPRYTQVIRLYPYEVAEKVAAGDWRDVRVEQDASEGRSQQDDEDGLVEFYEQHRLWDMDGDGFPEHYVVTTNRDGEVARIVPCFGPENVKVSVAGEVATLAELPQEYLGMVERVVKIDRRQYFTKYSFIPSPDGSFYDIGFGQLLYSLSETIDTSVNQMLDAGALQNAGGGFIGSGVSVRGGNFTFRLGEWKRTDSTGGPLKENIVPMPTAGPSAVLFELLQFLVLGAKEITASSDALTGTGASTEQPTTFLARVEQAQKTLTAVIKRVLRALGQDFRIIHRLNRDYLDEEEYFNLTDPVPEKDEDGQPVVGRDGEPMMTTVAKIGRADYDDKDLDVIPVADPSQISDVLRMARSDAEWQTFNGDPLVNQVWLRRRRMEALGIPDTKEAFKVPPPPEDPRLIIERLKLLVQKQDANSRQITAVATATEKDMNSARTAVEIGLLADAAALAERAMQENPNGAPDQPGGVPGMEGQPGDTGVLGAPPQAPVGPDGGMGAGGAFDPGGAGAGGPAGPAFTDQVPGGGSL